MGQHFELIDAETLARIERKLDLLNARMERNTLIPAPEWCSITEAAKRLGVSPATIRRKIAAGQLDSRGTGKTKQVHLV